jgi:exopolysaccharide biosynthesis polyprenyl glycosylphosphotransferase
VTPRVRTYVMIEVGAYFLTLCGVTFPWTTIFTLYWSEILSLLGQRIIPPLCLFVSFYGSDLYNLRVVKTLFEFRRRLVRPLLFTFFLLMGISWLTRSFAFFGSLLLSNLLTVGIGLCVVLPLRWGLYAFANIGPFAERVLILGTGEVAQKVAATIRALSSLGYAIAGFIDDTDPKQRETFALDLSPILGGLDRVEQIVEQFRPDRIIVALRERRGRTPLRTLLRAHWAGVVVEDGIKVLERFSGKLAVESLTPGFLIFSTDFKKPLPEVMLRRIISLVVAAIGLILTAPLFVLIAVAIKVDSNGPVFFIQERAGLNGRIFPLMKFRTMVSKPAETDANSVWDRDDNTRVTRVGHWLRMTHLDELPQFFNVLQGHMDLVGPRPEMATNIKTMEEQIPYFALRMSVRPGVTGWAQIKSGYAVSQEDVTEKIRYDLYYIKHRSFWLDFRILIDTAKLIFLGQENLNAHPPLQEKISTTISRGLKSNRAWS